MPTKDIKQRYKGQYTKWVIVLLVLLGLLAIGLRIRFHTELKVPGGDVLWTITLEAVIPSANKMDRVHISPPWNTEHIRIVSQRLLHTGMRVIRLKASDKDKRDIVLQAISPGNLTILAQFNAHISSTPQVVVSSTTKPLSTERRALFLASEDKIDLESLDVKTTYENINDRTTDSELLINNIFEYVNTKIVKDNTDTEHNAEIALRTHHASTLGRARAMVALCRVAGIPARVVTGFLLEDTFEPEPYHWVEAYQDDKWIPYDPEKGYSNIMPRNYLAFNRRGNPIVSSPNHENIRVSYSIDQNFDLAGLNISTQKKPSDIFDLERFPPDIRSNLGVLLLLPLGVLITTIFRNLLGVRSYGTFTPTLLALAAVYADWLAALVLLIIVIALAFTGRTAMPDKLSRIPRLAIMFTFVALSMIMGISLMEYFNLAANEHMVLLPIVILTSLIDRFYSTVDEDGFKLAIRRLIWTVVVGLFCYPVLKMESLGGVLLAYPETHFITIAVILLISTYKGKQLSGLPLFSWIKEPEKKEKTAKTKKASTSLSA